MTAGETRPTPPLTQEQINDARDLANAIDVALGLGSDVALLAKWLAAHPKIVVDREAENMEQPKCGQAERDALILRMTQPDIIFYGPHSCEECGKLVCKASREQGGMAFDYPDEPIYPNTNWVQHICAHPSSFAELLRQWPGSVPSGNYLSREAVAQPVEAPPGYADFLRQEARHWERWPEVQQDMLRRAAAAVPPPSPAKRYEHSPTGIEPTPASTECPCVCHTWKRMSIINSLCIACSEAKCGRPAVAAPEGYQQEAQNLLEYLPLFKGANYPADVVAKWIAERDQRRDAHWRTLAGIEQREHWRWEQDCGHYKGESAALRASLDDVVLKADILVKRCDVILGWKGELHLPEHFKAEIGGELDALRSAIEQAKKSSPAQPPNAAELADRCANEMIGNLQRNVAEQRRRVAREEKP